MNKEDILKQVGFDLNKAKAIYEWLTADTDQKPINLPPIDETAPVSMHYDEYGMPDGIRVCALDEDFIIALHDEFDGKYVDYNKASTVSLFTEKQVYVYYYYLDDINRLMVEAGGETLDDAWYWTKTKCAYNVNSQLVFGGYGGGLYSLSRILSLRVRVSLDLNTANS